MTSVRFDPELEHDLARAARRQNQTKSEFIRDAVRQRALEVLDEDTGPSTLWELVDAAGEGLDSTPIDSEFGADLAERHERETAEFLEELSRRRARPH